MLTMFLKTLSSNGSSTYATCIMHYCLNPPYPTEHAVSYEISILLSTCFMLMLCSYSIHKHTFYVQCNKSISGTIEKSARAGTEECTGDPHSEAFPACIRILLPVYAHCRMLKLEGVIHQARR